MPGRFITNRFIAESSIYTRDSIIANLMRHNLTILMAPVVILYLNWRVPVRYMFYPVPAKRALKMDNRLLIPEIRGHDENCGNYV